MKEDVISDLEEVNESIRSDTDGDNVQSVESVESVVAALEGNMQCFDDVYNVVERLASGGVDIGDGVKESIASRIKGDCLELKTFERALLLQKVAEL